MTARRVIEIEDQGQDFTRLLVDENNIITGAEPFQGWVWRGFRIIQKRLRRGMLLRLTKQKGLVIVLRYPVVRITTSKGGTL